MTMDWKQHIIVDPDILAGKPVINGTRISVELILDRTADGWSMEDILKSYPHRARGCACRAFVCRSAFQGRNLRRHRENRGLNVR